jgi:NAD(P)-dependent dehydrogenase (short-subunit alcohol dehydrogenase family)
MGSNNNAFNLSGKTALVTGAAGLLGIEHAKALLEIGALVILTDVDANALNKAKTKLIQQVDLGKVQSFLMDVTSEDSIIDVLSQLDLLNTRVDILINNAAINPTSNSLAGEVRSTRLENFSLERWNLELSVGLTGAYLCSKVFGSRMASDGLGGVILNIASDLSVIAPNQNLYKQKDLADEKQAVKPVTYSVIKTGLTGLTRYLASYWAEKGVRSNSLSPGGVYVDQDDEFVSRLENLIPMGRMAKKDEYAGAIQFLCSDASSYMSGQNIVIDGGRSVW